MRLALLTGVVILIKLIAASSPAHADMSDEPSSSQALTAIIDTAAKICGSIPTSGEQNSIQIKGTITAELNGLVKKLADLGISGAGDLSSTTYEGLLQKDIPAALNDARSCRMHIFDTLQEKLLPNQKSGSAWLDDDLLATFEYVDLNQLFGTGTSMRAFFQNKGQREVRLRWIAVSELFLKEGGGQSLTDKCGNPGLDNELHGTFINPVPGAIRHLNDGDIDYVMAVPDTYFVEGQKYSSESFSVKPQTTSEVLANFSIHRVDWSTYHSLVMCENIGVLDSSGKTYVMNCPGPQLSHFQNDKAFTFMADTPFGPFQILPLSKPVCHHLPGEVHAVGGIIFR